MSARQVNNFLQVIVGGDDNTGAAIPALSSLADGQVGIYTPGGTLMTETLAATETNFMVARGTAAGTPLVISDVINKNKIKSISRRTYVTPTEQLDYIGYNGTSGSIEVFDNNLYMVQVYVEDYLTSSHDGRYIKHFQYESDATASQSEIALGLAGSAYHNWSREAKDVNGDPFMTFKAICNDAGAALSATTGTIDAVKGSKILLAATDADGEMAVNDFWRAGTAVTDPVYKVVAINTTTEEITLDRPFEGTTQQFGATATEYITAALGAAADWGVALQGVDKPYVTGKEFHGKVRFTVNAKDFGSTVITNSTVANEGNGAVNQVIDHEWFANGNLGEIYRDAVQVGHPFVTKTTAGYTYDAISITYEDDSVVGFQANISPKQLIIYVPSDDGAASVGNTPDYAGSGTADDITDVLETLAGTSLIAAGGLDLGT